MSRNRRPAPQRSAAQAEVLSVDAIIEQLIEREGGFVNHPSDPGGATNYGITIGTLSGWLGRRATVAEVRALTREEAATIYRQQYWSGPGYDRLDVDQRVAVNAFDAGVMSGQRTGIRLLQRALRSLGGVLEIDGAVGPQTNRVAREVQDRVGVVALQNALCDARQAFYESIIARRPASEVFRRGWTNRVNKFRLREGSVATEIRNVPAPTRAAPPAEPVVVLTAADEEEIRNAGRALPVPPPATRDPAVVGGAATGGLAAASAASEIIGAATQAQAAAEAFPWLRVGLAVAVMIAAGLLAYAFIRQRRAAAVSDDLG